LKSRLNDLRPRSPPARTRIMQENEKTLGQLARLLDTVARPVLFKRG
jgi:hypothetical protein